MADERRSEDLAAVTRDAVLTRGLGRSYGDASLPAVSGARVANSTLAERVLGFDESTGVLQAEAGISLLRLNQLFLGRGWFVPVTPGTQFVTLGGMVASDVHGKGHHRYGSFGTHVERLVMRTAAGRVLECANDREGDLFRATLGGMGLTGHVLEVAFRMRRVPSPWIFQQVRRFDDLERLLAALGESGEQWPYTVGWMDCLSTSPSGRAVLMRGRWAQPEQAPPEPPKARPRIAVPFSAPGWLLNRLSARLNNWNYLRSNREGEGVVDPEAFFYPLDWIGGWNLLYGRRGFTQYQNVLPGEDVPRFFEHLHEFGTPPFLCVIKDFGGEGKGMISFPRPGVTLALDFPIDRRTPELIHHLNRFTIESGGRVYLSKDAFTTAEQFREMEPRLPAWNAVRRSWDPENRLRSALSVRLLGDPA
jgi:FAD/FMN-containing dehydrogenase